MTTGTVIANETRKSATAALAQAGALPPGTAIFAFTRDDLPGAAWRLMVLYGGVLIVVFGDPRVPLTVMMDITLAADLAAPLI